MADNYGESFANTYISNMVRQHQEAQDIARQVLAERSQDLQEREFQSREKDAQETLDLNKQIRDWNQRTWKAKTIGEVLSPFDEAYQKATSPQYGYSPEKAIEIINMVMGHPEDRAQLLGLSLPGDLATIPYTRAWVAAQKAKRAQMQAAQPQPQPTIGPGAPAMQPMLPGQPQLSLRPPGSMAAQNPITLRAPQVGAGVMPGPLAAPPRGAQVAPGDVMSQPSPAVQAILDLKRDTGDAKIMQAQAAIQRADNGEQMAKAKIDDIQDKIGFRGWRQTYEQGLLDIKKKGQETANTLAQSVIQDRKARQAIASGRLDVLYKHLDLQKAKFARDASGISAKVSDKLQGNLARLSQQQSSLIAYAKDITTARATFLSDPNTLLLDAETKSGIMKRFDDEEADIKRQQASVATYIQQVQRLRNALPATTGADGNKVSTGGGKWNAPPTNPYDLVMQTFKGVSALTKQGKK